MTDTNPMSFEEHMKAIYNALNKLQNSADRIEEEAAAFSIRLITVENFISCLNTQQLPERTDQ